MRTGIAAVAAMLLTGTAFAEERRELAPHEHGRSAMAVAIEAGKVAIELRSPGMDIVGFEHVAVSEADKAAVAGATALLRAPLDLFGVPAAAGCSVASVDVRLGTEDGDHDHDEAAHAEGETGVDQGDDHDHDHADQHEEGEAVHSEFLAAYTLDCATPSALTELSFGFFERFPNAEQIDVSVIGERGQSAFSVVRGNPRLSLDGLT